MKQALNLKQSQRLSMTPQLQQAIKLLQMNTAELSEELLSAHESNPLLELEDPVQNEPDPRTEKPDDTSSQEEFESTTEYAETVDPDWAGETVYSNVSSATPLPGDNYDIPDSAGSVSLKQSLLSQLALSGHTDQQKLMVEQLIEYVDDAGYLELPYDEIAAAITPSNNADQSVQELQTERLDHALGILQAMEPTGVGARNPEECLRLQLNFLADDTEALEQARVIVDQYLKLLAARDYQLLRRKLGVSEQLLKQAIDLIKTLNPHPGYSVGDAAVDYIAPDIVVVNHNGVWLARLNSGALPKVMINQDYQQLIGEQGGNEKFSKMREQLQDAKWLLSNIEKRHNTILSVASQIVERQQAFFENGPSAMRPMILRDVSEALDIHESTVSRATNGKYMLTPLGVFELRYFFSTEMSLDDGGNTSSVAIQSVIREMIEKEQSTKPISDMKICQALQNQGYELARRTVAKYREQMNIPSSSKRKTL